MTNDEEALHAVNFVQSVASKVDTAFKIISYP